MLFYGAFALLMVLPRQLFTYALAIWMGAILAQYIGLLPIVSPYQSCAFSLHCSQFIAGSVVALLIINKKVSFGRTFVGIGIAWLFGSITLNMLGYFSTDPLAPLVWEFGIGSAFLIFGIASLDVTNKPTYNRHILLAW